MPASRQSFAAQWRWHVRHASRGYWIAQALFLCTVFGLSALMTLALTQSSGAQAREPAHMVFRFLTDAGLLLLFTHVLIRPLLLMFFVHRRPTWRSLLAGLGLLFVYGYINLLASYLLGKLITPRDGINFEQIRFHAGDSAYDFDVGTTQLILLGGFNQFTMLLLWSVLYLAWKEFESRRQLQRQVRDARLQLLTGQLSPHFLFNAFNTIRGMIFEDRERAAELVTQLSELFRFHLSAGIRTETTLAEDWEIARRYLDLEAVRLESRLRLEVDLDPALMPRTLPILTLLTLVENAIKHGIAPNRDGGRLSIRAQAAGRGWTLEVENSIGRGVAEHSGGHGLANLRERVSLAGDERVRLHVEHDSARFLVRLELPR
ncbi:histidine kinase [Luteimonas sp. BDR2-5]|uniref:sensor histidine kinase n=1 Tax=Proluteimonas luteida TaxID=2878685 RepID=UPI001E58B809|nr:histidine kinase [Luteimonas sp. BDR2-5]MCD9027636.1 histidine kinase [Luteimonas sp. BDR2-5]